MLHRSRISLALVAGALVVGAVPSSAVAAQEIEGQYIVVLKEDAGGDTAKRKARARGGKVQREFSRALNGFSATLDAKALAEVKQDPAVEYVEPDRVITLAATQQNPPSWGLDRIDQRNRPLSAGYTYEQTGAGVDAYIVDTGIAAHGDFGTIRLKPGYSAIGGTPADCNGHGTHVAGTVGGTNHGVAKGVSLIPVRVLNCSGSGSTSGVIAGVDWVTANHQPGQPAVANMSLGGGASTTLDRAVQTAINDGVTFVVAAGNESQNACNVSPARAANAITVGATTSTDARASYSNYGSCLDLFAPGSGITSTWLGGGTNTISGTSMASPHVAGAAALRLQANPGSTPAQITSELVSAATTNVVANPGSGSPNRLLYTGAAGGGQPTTCAAQVFSRSLAAGATDKPLGESFTAAAGAHKGCVTGPTGSDFDLYLERWSGSRWVAAASGTSPNASEIVTYNGVAGTYRWIVHAYSGGGAYTFEVTRP